MSRLAYLDLASGASGDMLLAALADAGRRMGADVEGAMVAAVDALDLDCSVAFVEDRRGALRCLRAEVRTDDRTHAVDHLRTRIEDAAPNQASMQRARTALDLLVTAEAQVHGIDPSAVHLHELGSADTAADVLGTAVGFDVLEASGVAAAPVPVPGGWIDTAHGLLPLPAPATLELLQGVKVRGVGDTKELVTPTAIAVLRAHGCSFGPLPAMTLDGVGVGGGTRDTPRPNVCRVLVGRPHPESGPGLNLEYDVLLETNLDDQSPEGVAHALDMLMGAGAKDAWVTPVVMKKSRPAFQLSILLAPDDERKLLDVLFRQTTTLGVRRRETTKWALAREEIRVTVRNHEVRVKVARLDDRVVNVAPEFEDCADLASRTDVPLKDLYVEVTAEAQRILAER